MPELPEVETISRKLRDGSPDSPSIVGQVIEAARIHWARTLATPGIREAEQWLQGCTILDVSRRAKFILIHLDRGCLLMHLRMSGDVLVFPASKPDDPAYARFSLQFRSGRRMLFTDARKFGRIWLVDDPQLILKNLGPEPLESAFTPAVLHAKLMGKKRQLKPLLMDQTFLAGLGNIYTDEALHQAKLHPLRNAQSLSQAESAALHSAIQTVLLEGIERNGASIDWVYRGGDFQNHFHVYQRTGETCPRCGTRIERILVGQRGTHFCPTCQKL